MTATEGLAWLQPLLLTHFKLIDFGAALCPYLFLHTWCVLSFRWLYILQRKWQFSKPSRETFANKALHPLYSAQYLLHYTVHKLLKYIHVQYLMYWNQWLLIIYKQIFLWCNIRGKRTTCLHLIKYQTHLLEVDCNYSSVNFGSSESQTAT